MKNHILYYSVGPLLYCPANRDSITTSIINENFGRQFSLALCLEDTINDNFVAEAEQKMLHSLQDIDNACQNREFYLPRIFIRVRNPEQITRLTIALKSHMDIITGFIIPKFSPANAHDYINKIIEANELAGRKIYMMPIYESEDIIDLRTRYQVLYSLKDALSQVEELVLNIRVGGNDLCHLFGFRRHPDESIHEIKPVSSVFTDIVTVYGTDYVISGPVWEYYAGGQWEEGLRSEIRDDRLCGFTGKTVIHPNQIAVVNSCFQVSQADYKDAQNILHWDNESSTLVAGSQNSERMNECKTHTNWARQILYLAEVYGIRAE